MLNGRSRNVSHRDASNHQRPNLVRGGKATGSSPIPKFDHRRFPRKIQTSMTHLHSQEDSFPAPRQPKRSIAPETPPPPPPEGGSHRRISLKWLSWLATWQFWVLSTGLMFGAAGFISVAFLLRLPTLPNCPSIFWPLASASMRLSCARVAAQKENVDDLLEAIALVNALPPDHPLRPSINQYIEEWTLDILELSEQQFHAGNLSEAIATARQVPTEVPIGEDGKTLEDTVEERIERWRAIWTKAEEIYDRVEAQLKGQNWPKAFREATKLLEVGNRYWETTKYNEVTKLIQTAREDGAKLAKAQRLVNRGGVDRILEAIEIAEDIKPESYVYSEAQKAIGEYGRKMMALAEAALEREDLTEAMSIARKIPASANLTEEAKDFIVLAQAESQAWNNTVVGLESAIAQAQKLGPDSPLYSKAQRSIDRWQQTIENAIILEQARDFARSGNVSDLTTAINQAQMVSRSTPVWDEARDDIEQWNDRIERLEDRPILERAEQLAQLGDVESLQSAIDEASKIGSSRALYQQAQSNIADWQARIEQIQDRPYLDRARGLASAGNLEDAIAVAENIRPGRSLYGEAQASISDWEAQLRAERSLDEAYDLASGGTSDSLLAAIERANQVPRSSFWRSEADSLIAQWSQEVLAIARDVATYDLAGAIAIADRIPYYANNYEQAQRKVEEWDRLLNPPPPPSPDPATQERQIEPQPEVEEDPIIEEEPIWMEEATFDSEPID